MLGRGKGGEKRGKEGKREEERTSEVIGEGEDGEQTEGSRRGEAIKDKRKWKDVTDRERKK